MNITNTTQSMSSKEIAKLTGSRHDSVKRTIERLAEPGVITFTPMVEPIPGGGKPVTIYLVNQREEITYVRARFQMSRFLENQESIQNKELEHLVVWNLSTITQHVG